MFILLRARGQGSLNQIYPRKCNMNHLCLAAPVAQKQIREPLWQLMPAWQELTELDRYNILAC